MYFSDFFLTRGRLPLSSFLCFVGGFSMGSWITLFHQLQAEKDLIGSGDMRVSHSHEPILLLGILIISAPLNSQHRTTLRNTWLKLSPSSPRIRHFFLIGTRDLSTDIRQNLEAEADREEDLLLLHDLEDSFQTLTQKVSEGISILTKNSPFLYLLKCDDDSFVRVDRIWAELEGREREMGEKNWKECFYWGFFDGRAPIKRRGKWKEGDYSLCDTYLPYALGGGYIISKACADFIKSNQHVLKSYLNEDVSIGTWLSVIPTHRRHDERFDTEWESRGCHDSYLIQHKISQVEMQEKYRNLMTKGSLCSEELSRRSGYIYNWGVPPSQCCHRNVSVI